MGSPSGGMRLLSRSVSDFGIAAAFYFGRVAKREQKKADEAAGNFQVASKIRVGKRVWRKNADKDVHVHCCG